MATKPPADSPPGAAPGQPPRASADRLAPIVYDELRACAARALQQERPDHTLQPTALVHEVFLKLAEQTRARWKGETHFIAVAAQAMRRILVDHARGHARDKRGGGRPRVELPECVGTSPEEPVDVLAVEEALQKLERLDPRQARVVELRFFGGLSVDQIAAALELSPRTVDVEWSHAKAWLRRELACKTGNGYPSL